MSFAELGTSLQIYLIMHWWYFKTPYRIEAPWNLLHFRHIFAAFSGFANSSHSQIVDFSAPVTFKFEGRRKK